MIRYKQVLLDRGIWEIWHDKNWEDYEGIENRNKVITHMNEKRSRGLILYGTNGTGKTMLLNLAMKDYLLGGVGEVYVIDFRQLVSAYTNSWGRDSDGLIDKLLNVRFLGIDDIGKEFKGGDVSLTLASTALDYVLRYRFQRKNPTWITMNMELSEVKSCYNEHIASLLKRCCDAAHIDGTDYGDRLFTKK